MKCHTPVSYGDGVNIAARLESLAEAGGLCISGTVYDQIKTKLALGYEDLGAQAVKNIAEPVRVYRVQLDPGAAVPAMYPQAERTVGEFRGSLPQQAGAARRGVVWSWRQGALALVGLLLLLGGGVTVWQRSVHQSPTVAVPDPSLRRAPRLSLVVLPFQNLSGDASQEY